MCGPSVLRTLRGVPRSGSCPGDWGLFTSPSRRLIHQRLPNAPKPPLLSPHPLQSLVDKHGTPMVQKRKSLILNDFIFMLNF